MNSCDEIETEVPGILLLTHGRAGEELIRSAEMIVGPLQNVWALSLMPGMGMENFLKEVRRILDTVPDGSVLISDLFGGTPANTSAFVSKNRNIAAVSGLSLPMLIEAVSSRGSMAGEELAAAVIAAGREGCRNILATLQGVE